MTAPTGCNALSADVIIVGGGPCGLVLGHELGRRGVRTLLFNDQPGTTIHPQAGATQARTMEHFRRLGVAHLVRQAGLPADWPTDIAYLTRFNGEELSRFALPASGAAGALVRNLSGSWSSAELPHRCSQMLVERILRAEAEKLPSLSMRFGCTVTGFTDHVDRVEVDVVSGTGDRETVSAQYLVGADGARGITRNQLGVRYGGETTMDRPFLSGRMYSIYFRSDAVFDIIPHGRAWQYWAVNPERRGMMISLDGRNEFVFVTQLRPDQEPGALGDEEVKAFLHSAMGEPFDLEIISRAPWTAGLALVAEKFQVGRVFLGGDAAHLFTPTGGLGYNTAVDDAVNLGWKLAAAIQGWAGPEILASYELEREPLARRNTNYARIFADSIGRFVVPAYLEEESERGAEARRDAGAYLVDHARKEFNIPGITFGGRYDGSPLIVSDGSEPPPDSASVYVPTASPGGRAPHAWLSDGRSLYDALGFEFTLLLLGAHRDSAETLVSAAVERGIPLAVLDLRGEGLRELYEVDLALVRPDQIICWRGDQVPADAGALLDQVTGRRRGEAAPARSDTEQVGAAVEQTS